MICPDCGNTEASIGEASISETNETLVKINCPNQECTNYDGSAAVVEEDDPYDDGYNNYEDEDEDDDYDDYDDGPVRADPFARPSTVRDTNHIAVRILAQERRRNTIEISFALAGDASIADKCVEFFWWKHTRENKKCAQLSNNCGTFVKGLRADGMTVYKTHWKCRQDGVEPTEEGITLEPNVF